MMCDMVRKIGGVALVVTGFAVTLTAGTICLQQFLYALVGG